MVYVGLIQTRATISLDTVSHQLLSIGSVGYRTKIHSNIEKGVAHRRSDGGRSGRRKSKVAQRLGTRVKKITETLFGRCTTNMTVKSIQNDDKRSQTGDPVERSPCALEAFQEKMVHWPRAVRTLMAARLWVKSYRSIPK